MIEVLCSRCGGAGHVLVDEIEVACPRCRGKGAHSEIIYANVFRVTRQYGGPEEGGWWYDAGEVIGSIRVLATDCEDRLRKYLMRAYEDEQCLRGRHSAAGGADVVIRLEDHEAEPFPSERPVYC